MIEDVVVVGAGPTGLMLACELRLAGVRPLVVERLSAPTGLSKALGLGGRAVDLLDHRGLLQRFRTGTAGIGKAGSLAPLWRHPHRPATTRGRATEVRIRVAGRHGTSARRTRIGARDRRIARSRPDRTSR